MSILLLFLSVSIGSVFVFSARAKLNLIEPFELIFVDLGVVNWQFSPYLARFIIGFELCLGLLLIFKNNFRIAVLLSSCTLVFFSLYLLYAKFILGNNENCGCLGELIKLNPLESVFKNIIILALLYIVFRFDENIDYWKKLKIPILLALISLSVSLPFILNKVNKPKKLTIESKVGQTFKIELLENKSFSNHKDEDMMKGKRLFCFLSLTCSGCKYIANKISVLQRKNDNTLPIYFIFPSPAKEGESHHKFIHETKTTNVPYLILDKEKISEIAGKHFPTIFFVEDGKIVKHNNYRDFFPSEAQAFLQ